MSDRHSGFKSFASGFVKAASAVSTALSDGPKRVRIAEIDEELINLKDERDYLITQLINPLPDEKVSEDYVPGRYHPNEPSVKIEHISGEGRLVECGGRRTMGLYHNAHPGCPYVDDIHIAHDFMLRD